MSANIPASSIEKRPWGEELWFCADTATMIKILYVNPGETLSLQYHHLRDEYWRVISGNGSAQVGDDGNIPLKTGSECYIPREIKHRLRGGTETLVLLELSFGEFNQLDIVRLEDKYGRA